MGVFVTLLGLTGYTKVKLRDQALEKKKLPQNLKELNNSEELKENED